MTYSPLTTEMIPPTRQSYGNKWSSRPSGTRIRGLNVHHHATTGTGGITRLTKSADKASANYIIRTSGALIGSVPEEYQAWTSGGRTASGKSVSSADVDKDKITVEIQNETGAPEWRISDAAWATLVRLYADVAKRHGFAPTRANIKGHQEYGVATACPGPYLLPRLGQVATEAAALLGAAHVDKPVTPPAPTPPKPTGLTVDGKWGADTTRWLQEVLGTPVDGVVSRQSATWRDQNPGLTTGWDWAGRPGDGGSKVIAALQRILGVTADGKIGPATITALQRRLGTPVDGVISKPSKAVAALQRRLNEGRV